MKATADGDGRYILNLAESVLNYAKEGEIFDKESLLKIIRPRAPVYDKGRDGHYNLISAVHKSLRGSDVDAALYWVARMITAGEDPKYIFRRLTRFAVEDVSMADPNAVQQAIACWDTYERLGRRKAIWPLMQLTVYSGNLHPNRPVSIRRCIRRWIWPKDRLADAAEAYFECADQVDERVGLQSGAMFTIRIWTTVFRGRIIFPMGSAAKNCIVR